MLHDLKTKRHSVERSITALQAISTTKPPRAKGRYIIEADDSEFFVSVKPKSQRLSKSSRCKDSVRHFDPTPSQALGRSPLTNNQEGIDLAYKLLTEQKMVLQVNYCAFGLTL